VDVPPRPARLHRNEAVIVDMDGVVADTAELHAAAWKQLFDEVLADHRDAAGRPAASFDADAGYRVYVDGRTRENGLSAFLTARGIDVPAGNEGDPADAQTVHGLATRKNALFLGLVDERGPGAFPPRLPCCGGCGPVGFPPLWSRQS
jgi:beta-phosphoglucomutase-like phosphatase (HAD superfamily)